jgi:phage-related protein
MSDSAPKIPFNDETRAKSSIKSLNFELSNLTPSALVTMFEIDLNKLIQTKGINLQDQARDVNFGGDVNDGILRFHNNINIFNSYIIWRGKTYYPAP